MLSQVLIPFPLSSLKWEEGGKNGGNLYLLFLWHCPCLFRKHATAKQRRQWSYAILFLFFLVFLKIPILQAKVCPVTFFHFLFNVLIGFHHLPPLSALPMASASQPTSLTALFQQIQSSKVYSLFFGGANKLSLLSHVCIWLWTTFLLPNIFVLS